jgi:hypothetical protein
MDIPNSLVGQEHGYPYSCPTSKSGISLFEFDEKPYGKLSVYFQKTKISRNDNFLNIKSESTKFLLITSISLFITIIDD